MGPDSELPTPPVQPVAQPEIADKPAQYYQTREQFAKMMNEGIDIPANPEDISPIERQKLQDKLDQVIRENPELEKYFGSEAEIKAAVERNRVRETTGFIDPEQALEANRGINKFFADHAHDPDYLKLFNEARTGSYDTNNPSDLVKQVNQGYSSKFPERVENIFPKPGEQYLDSENLNGIKEKLYGNDPEFSNIVQQVEQSYPDSSLNSPNSRQWRLQQSINRYEARIKTNPEMTAKESEVADPKLQEAFYKEAEQAGKNGEPVDFNTIRERARNRLKQELQETAEASQMAKEVQELQEQYKEDPEASPYLLFISEIVKAYTGKNKYFMEDPGKQNLIKLAKDGINRMKTPKTTSQAA